MDRAIEYNHFTMIDVRRPVILILILFSSSCGKENEACRSETECVNIKRAWSFFGLVPVSQQETGIRFFIRNRNVNRTELPLEGVVPYLGGFFDSTPTRHFTFIIHGFMSSSDAPWIRNMENVLLRNEDTNVILVDWSKESRAPYYFQAAINTRTVATIISKFIINESKRGLMAVDNIHIIGHSLGAHLASYVANLCPGVIAHITGLDPAKPGFKVSAKDTVLDASDANYVEILHTGTAWLYMIISLGQSEPLGHVDFYMNGGASQPVCDNKLSRMFNLSATLNSLSCNHNQAQSYYIEALNRSSQCPMVGLKWDLNYTNIPSTYTECRLDNCQEVGPNGRLLPGRGIFFVPTSHRPPFCLRSQAMSLEFMLKRGKYYVSDAERYKSNLL